MNGFGGKLIYKGIDMKMISKIAGAVIGLSLLSGAAHAVPITDVQDVFTTAGNTVPGGTYWLDVDANKGLSPYWRGDQEEWGWSQGSIASPFTSAVLDISAYDVDSPSEVDNIEVWTGAAWFNLGTLVGSDGTWSFTSFDLTPYLGAWATAQINAGLQVRIDISVGQPGNWLVTLAKSTLSVDGGSQNCVPQPGVPCTPGGGGVPEPAPTLFLGLGLAAIVATRQRRRMLKK
jgi:hypothetical protein